MSRVIGVDVGTKRLGLAIGDTDTGVALPFGVIELAGKTAFEVLVGVLKDEMASSVVLGSPAEGALKNEVEKLAEELKTATGLSVTVVDEHLTTKIADMLSREVGSRRHDDALAAMLILEEYFSSNDKS